MIFRELERPHFKIPFATQHINIFNCISFDYNYISEYFKQIQTLKKTRFSA